MRRRRRESVGVFRGLGLVRGALARRLGREAIWSSGHKVREAHTVADAFVSEPR